MRSEVAAMTRERIQRRCTQFRGSTLVTGMRYNAATASAAAGSPLDYVLRPSKLTHRDLRQHVVPPRLDSDNAAYRESQLVICQQRRQREIVAICGRRAMAGDVEPLPDLVLVQPSATHNRRPQRQSAPVAAANSTRRVETSLVRNPNPVRAVQLTCSCLFQAATRAPAAARSAPPPLGRATVQSSSYHPTSTRNSRPRAQVKPRAGLKATGQRRKSLDGVQHDVSVCAQG